MIKTLIENTVNADRLNNICLMFNIITASSSVIILPIMTSLG